MCGLNQFVLGQGQIDPKTTDNQDNRALPDDERH
jgi:hypothetical protein